jgi:hypothetical protein
VFNHRLAIKGACWLDDAQAHIKGGWEKITDQASSKLNEWLKS